MDETIIGILGCTLLIGFPLGLAFWIYRRSKDKGHFLILPKNVRRIVAIVLGLVNLAIYIIDETPSFLYLLLGVAFIAYGLGEDRLLRFLEGISRPEANAGLPFDKQADSRLRTIFFILLTLIVGVGLLFILVFIVSLLRGS
ncbi:MAG: hypothetical protein GTO14_22590 [Anaerolineales bacterium]|nr:hypothetical protein [Anaerolineales bacterium]